MRGGARHGGGRRADRPGVAVGTSPSALAPPHAELCPGHEQGHLLGLRRFDTPALRSPSPSRRSRPVDLLAGDRVLLGRGRIRLPGHPGEHPGRGSSCCSVNPFAPATRSKVMGSSGTVSEINIRETRIVTYHGELVIIPNRDVYKSVIVVHTHRPHHRMQFTVGIAYENDAEAATATIVEALASVAGVEHEPRPLAWCGSWACRPSTSTPCSGPTRIALVDRDARCRDQGGQSDSSTPTGSRCPPRSSPCRRLRASAPPFRGRRSRRRARCLGPDEARTSNRDGTGSDPRPCSAGSERPRCQMRLSSLLERLKSSLFFVPMTAVIGAIVLAAVVLTVDGRVVTRTADLPLGLTSTVESAGAAQHHRRRHHDLRRHRLLGIAAPHPTDLEPVLPSDHPHTVSRPLQPTGHGPGGRDVHLLPGRPAVGAHGARGGR